MTQTLPTSRLRLRRSTGLTFVATTTALVLLASLGTAVLVRFGSGGLVVVPPQVIAPVGGGPVLRPTQSAPPPVDRIVGSFQAPVVHAAGPRRPPTLGELLSPPQVSLPTPRPSAPSEPELPFTLPTALPTAFPTGPPPSPVALPLPVPVPEPITVRLPRPLPDLVLFPGGLVTTSPSPLPISLP